LHSFGISGISTRTSLKHAEMASYEEKQTSQMDEDRANLLMVAETEVISIHQQRFPHVERST
jgi:hypothetical protein